MSEDGKNYQPWPARAVTTLHLALAGALLLIGVVALLKASAAMGLIAVVMADAFVLSLLRCCGIASTPQLSRRPFGRAVRNTARERWEVFPYLPTRTTALILLPVLLATLIAAFGGLYLSTLGGVLDGQSPAEPLAGRLDAIYFSFVTITTLGYGDFHPVSAVAKWIVMGELGSGILMLVGAVPLLITRLTTWQD
jgi:Ion channel